MDSITINRWDSSGNYLNQIYSSGFEYSLYNDKYEQVTQFYRCRDWAPDCVYAYLHNTSISIYGLTYNSSIHPSIDLENTRFLLTNDQDSHFLTRVENFLDFLHQVEELMHLRKTEVYLVSNPPNKYQRSGIIATIGSGRWQRAPVLLSMYTLLLRIGFCHVKGKSWIDTVKGVANASIPPYQKNDGNYLRQSLPAIEKIINLGYKKIFFIDPKNNYPATIDTYTLHDYSGIVAYANKHTNHIIKHWNRSELDEEYNNMKKNVILS